jgi:osmotically-inducible protein OsmY
VSKFLSALAAAAVFAGLSQAASVAKPVTGTPLPTAAAKASTPVRALPDAQIEHDIRMNFGKSKINAEHFTVSVKNGVATLDGKTNVIQHKGVATRLAKKGGAIAVENRIQVSEEAKARAAATLAKNRGEGPPVRAVVVPPAKPK